MSDERPTVFRSGGVSYLRIPAPDPARSAAFYSGLFGWTAKGDAGGGRFEDRSGHVIGHFITDMVVAGEGGIRPYIYVDSVQDTIERLPPLGGELVTAPYREGDLTVATCRDPAGNVIGIWQRTD